MHAKSRDEWKEKGHMTFVRNGAALKKGPTQRPGLGEAKAQSGRFSGDGLSAS
jgi:hypothetical protein